MGTKNTSTHSGTMIKIRLQEAHGPWYYALCSMDLTGNSGLEWTTSLQLCENIPHLCEKSTNGEGSTSNAQMEPGTGSLTYNITIFSYSLL